MGPIFKRFLRIGDSRDLNFFQIHKPMTHSKDLIRFIRQLFANYLIGYPIDNICPLVHVIANILKGLKFKSNRLNSFNIFL